VRQQAIVTLNTDHSTEWRQICLVAVALAGLIARQTPAQRARRDDESARAPSVTTLAGTVYDSIAMRPLAEALVQLAEVPRAGGVGAVRSTRSDSLGRYEFEGLRPATYLLGFQHIAIDSLGLRGSVTRLDVRTPSSIRVPLAVPSSKSIIASACGAPSVKDSIALLVGNVRDARNDALLPKSYLSLRWGEVYLSKQGLLRETPILDLFTNEDGWFVACVPGGIPVLTRATHDDDASGDVELAVPAHSVLRRDLYVGFAEAAIAGDDSIRRSGTPGAGERIVTRGRASIRGLVRGTDGRPLSGARVALLSGATETRTDDNGRFTLTAVPHGTHTLEARALGYLPAQEIVDIVAFRETAAEFYLIDAKAFLLDTMHIAAARHLEAAARAGFERRRRQGVGFFLDESQIDSIHPFSFKDLVRTIPGIRFVRGTTIETTWREHIEFTAARSHPCLPAIYLDGALLLSGPTDLDIVINPSTVRRIEVYHRGNAGPVEFASVKECGVMAIWTGARLPIPERPIK
jgi:hypothetical protein